MKRTLLTMALLMASIGCSSGGERSVTYTAEAVFMDEPLSVTILMRNDDRSLSPVRFSARSVEFKDDIVDAKVHPYLTVMESQEFGDWIHSKIIVHVHSVNEIQPGHWDHGKFGNGQTQRVE